MEHTKTLTKYMANFVDELIANGLEHVVISPGSRSTPLALTFLEREELEDWIIVDERSAAFFALGLAKQTETPVVLVCTSGTAAANYFPAIVEAYHSYVPLLILTADRPHELRLVDAPQAIDQQKMYGTYVVHYDELALPEQTETALRYVRQRAASSFRLGQSKQRPVHLNIPLREPLLPDFSDLTVWERPEGIEANVYPQMETEQLLTESSVENLIELLTSGQRGLLVCGPQTSLESAKALVELAQTFKLPLLADPLSQVRNIGATDVEIISTYDAILRTKVLRERLKPEFVIRFGAMPVSKVYRFFIEEAHEATQYIVSPMIHYKEQTGKKMHFIHTGPVQFVEQMLKAKKSEPSTNKTWITLWMGYNERAKTELLKTTNTYLSEGSAVVHLQAALARANHRIFIANSMAIRDFDTFYLDTTQVTKLYANRGVNGIDGVVSTALGVAATGKPVVLFIGDLSLYHDLNGLMTGNQYELPLTIVLMNNNGGGIFSFLPQRHDKNFEKLFGTPLDIDFSYAAKLYNADYHHVKTVEEYQDVLKIALEKPRCTLIEVQTNREENYHWHQERWLAVEQAILQKEDDESEEND